MWLNIYFEILYLYWYNFFIKLDEDPIDKPKALVHSLIESYFTDVLIVMSAHKTDLLLPLPFDNRFCKNIKIIF